MISRGDRGEAIYRDDEDRRLFLKSMGEVCSAGSPAERGIYPKEINKLLQNARQCTSPDGAVWISADPFNRGLRILFANTGAESTDHPTRI